MTISQAIAELIHDYPGPAIFVFFVCFAMLCGAIASIGKK